jgi:hypothetical protein
MKGAVGWMHMTFRQVVNPNRTPKEKLKAKSKDSCNVISKIMERSTTVGLEFSGIKKAR